MEISKDLKRVIRQSWDASTCYPLQKEEWKNEIPEIGQCAVTALLLQDYLGGDIAFNEANDHFWNILPNGESLDLTHKQFKKPVKLHVDALCNRKDILYSEEAVRQKTLFRYNLLKSRVEQKLVKAPLLANFS